MPSSLRCGLCLALLLASAAAFDLEDSDALSLFQVFGVDIEDEGRAFQAELDGAGDRLVEDADDAVFESLAADPNVMKNLRSMAELAGSYADLQLASVDPPAADPAAAGSVASRHPEIEIVVTDGERDAVREKVSQFMGLIRKMPLRKMFGTFRILLTGDEADKLDDQLDALEKMYNDPEYEKFLGNQFESFSGFANDEGLGRTLKDFSETMTALAQEKNILARGKAMRHMAMHMGTLMTKVVPMTTKIATSYREYVRKFMGGRGLDLERIAEAKKEARLPVDHMRR